MKVALLVCDDSSRAFPHHQGSYLDMFVRLFSFIKHNVELIPFDVRFNNYPDDWGIFNGFLTTGSSFSVYEDVPWIQELKNFTCKLYESGHKFFGVCFGHQLIAESLGGKVAKAPQGWMVGVKQTDIILNKSWMDPQSSHCMVISSHQDQIIQLPPKAEVIGFSEGCPYSMIALADHFVGFQGHPEFSKAYALPLMESRQDRIPKKIIQEAKQSFEISPEQHMLASWIFNFFNQH
jgi:GMP synthase (glutamine-hydrolysing)